MCTITTEFKTHSVPFEKIQYLEVKIQYFSHQNQNLLLSAITQFFLAYPQGYAYPRLIIADLS
jgi:hypothetical protein